MYQEIFKQGKIGNITLKPACNVTDGYKPGGDGWVSIGRHDCIL